MDSVFGTNDNNMRVQLFWVVEHCFKSFYRNAKIKSFIINKTLLISKIIIFYLEIQKDNKVDVTGKQQHSFKRNTRPVWAAFMTAKEGRAQIMKLSFKIMLKNSFK